MTNLTDKSTVAGNGFWVFFEPASDSPVPPAGDAYSLDDEDHHLEEKHKEEEEEADGAVSPKNKKTKNSFKMRAATLSCDSLACVAEYYRSVFKS